MVQHVVLTGSNLTPEIVVQIANGATVSLHPAAFETMAKGREVVDRYFRESIPAYGLTTGLGMRADQMLSPEVAAEFSYRMVRGRAQALGELLSAKQARAVMAIRLNTLLSGAAGASAAVAQALVEVLNHGLIPAMPRIGSIGTGDLVAMASVAHALIGEGDMLVDGHRVVASVALEHEGLEPLLLQPKDGAVLCNNTAFSTGLAALAFSGARRAFAALQVAGALSLEGFEGNLSPFEPAVLRARPQPGQVEAGDQIRSLLSNAAFESKRSPSAVAHPPEPERTRFGRRLQDPLSFRCMAQVHGAAIAALNELRDELVIDLNSSPDNPVVLIDEGVCLSSGNFHLPRLTQTLDGVARSLGWCATDSVSRVQRLMHEPHSGLPPLLTADLPNAAGFGPLLKPAEALRAEIIHLSNPVPILSSHNADGIEDSVTFSALAATKLADLVNRLELLVAFELVAACQAIDLRQGNRRQLGVEPELGRALTGVYQHVRALSHFITEDRPIGRELEQIAQTLVASGLLSELIYE